MGKGWSEILLPNRDRDLVGVLELKTSWVFDSQILIGQLYDLYNIDSVSGDLVVSSHFVIELINSVLNRYGSELLEHILLTNVALVLEVNSVILGIDFACVEDFLDFKNFS